MKLHFLFTITLLVTACGGSSSKSNDAPVLLSELPDRALTQSEIDEISYSCDQFDVSDTENSCISFSMRETEYSGSIDVDIENFSEQDLMEKLEQFFPDPSLAPNIILYSDGLLEDGLINNGFNLFLR